MISEKHIASVGIILTRFVEKEYKSPYRKFKNWLASNNNAINNEQETTRFSFDHRNRPQ